MKRLIAIVLLFSLCLCAGCKADNTPYIPTGDGLTMDTIASCDYTVKIPMYHGVDSLNVAAASAVAFWELRAR